MSKKKYYDEKGTIIKFPFYKKWWFTSLVTIICMVFIIPFLFSGIFGTSEQEITATEKDNNIENSDVNSEIEDTEPELIKVNQDNPSNEFKNVITTMERVAVHKSRLNEHDINSLKENYPAVSSWVGNETYILNTEYSVENKSDQDVRQPVLLDVITNDGQQLDNNYIIEMGQFINDSYISGGNVNSILSASNKQFFYNTYIINPETLSQLTSIKFNMSGVDPIKLDGFGEDVYDRGWSGNVELINK